MNRLMTMFYLETTGSGVTTAMQNNFGYFTAALDNAIFGVFTAMITVLLSVAVGVGVFKKMFVFGNPQTITTANKIILTAIIGAVVMAVILPLKDFVIEEMWESLDAPGTRKTGDISIETGSETDKQRYTDFQLAVNKVKEFSKVLYIALYSTVSALALISVGIAAFRIKFSLGNPEVIADARRQIKMTIFAAVIMLGAVWGLHSWTKLVNESEFTNPISKTMEKTLNELLKDQQGLSATPPGAMDSSANIDQTWNKVKRAESPGLIVAVNYNKPNNDQNFKMPIDVKRGETYSFESPKSGADYVMYKNGVSTIRKMNENIMIFVFVNSGWKVAVSSNEGYTTIRVPRTDKYKKDTDGKKTNKDSLFKDLKLKYPPIKNLDDITNYEENKDYVKIDPEEEFPLQDQRNAFMVFSTIAHSSNNEIKEKKAYEDYDLRESAVPFRYIGPLRWEKHQGDGRYQISFTYSEDDEDQKAFKRVSFLGDQSKKNQNGASEQEKDGSGTIPVPSDYQYYILIDDITDEIASTPFLHDGVESSKKPAEKNWAAKLTHEYEKWISIDDANDTFKTKLWNFGKAMLENTPETSTN